MSTLAGKVRLQELRSHNKNVLAPSTALATKSSMCDNYQLIFPHCTLYFTLNRALYVPSHFFCFNFFFFFLLPNSLQSLDKSRQIWWGSGTGAQLKSATGSGRLRCHDQVFGGGGKCGITAPGASLLLQGALLSDQSICHSWKMSRLCFCQKYFVQRHSTNSYHKLDFLSQWSIILFHKLWHSPASNNTAADHRWNQY